MYHFFTSTVAHGSTERNHTATPATQTKPQKHFEREENPRAGARTGKVSHDVLPPGSVCTYLQISATRLQTERQTWETLLRPPAPDSLALTPLTTAPDPNIISSELLDDPSQASALSSLLRPQEKPQDPSVSSSDPSSSYPDLQTSTFARLQNIISNNNLEFSIDTFANNIHTLNSYQQATDRAAGEILGISAEALEERDKEGRRRDVDGGEVEEVSVRDVLRGLSRII